MRHVQPDHRGDPDATPRCRERLRQPRGRKGARHVQPAHHHAGRHAKGHRGRRLPVSRHGGRTGRRRGREGQDAGAAGPDEARAGRLCGGHSPHGPHVSTHRLSSFIPCLRAARRVDARLLLRLQPDFHRGLARSSTGASTWTSCTPWASASPSRRAFWAPSASSSRGNSCSISAILLAAFLSMGRYLEAKAKGRTGTAIKRLMGLKPELRQK